jgi:non-specific serine/threonine protein kinase
VPSPGSSIADASELGAVQLFVARGTDARPGFTLTRENLGAVGDVCRRLDGLPLALELAAARLAALTPEQIAERLDARFQLLAGGAQIGLERHRTLRATLEWSYELLASVQRQALRRVSVFAGAFSLGAAEAVVHGDEIPRSEVAGLVERLVECSLLDVRGDGRFQALETIRQYGLLRLAEAGEEQEARDRHLEWLAAAMERAEAEAEDTWYARIETEYAELRSGVAWSLAGRRPELGLRAVANTGSFLAEGAHAAEARGWLDSLLEHRGETSAECIADALSIRSRIAFLNGEYEVAERASREGLAISRAAGSGARVSAFVRQLGNIALYEGRIEDARSLYRTAVGEAADDELSVVRAQLNLGLAELMLGRLDAAERQFTEMLAISERAHPGEVPYGRSALAMVAVQRGDAAGAAGLIAAAIEGFQAKSNLYELAELVEMAGGVCLLTGDPAAAARLLGASDSVYEAAGGVRPEGYFVDRYRRWVDKARASLGERQATEVMVSGRGLRVADAIGIAHERMKALRRSSRPTAST